MKENADKNKSKRLVIYGILGAVTLAVVPFVVRLGKSFLGKELPGNPEPGAVIFRDLGMGYCDHSGIYVGGGEKCIVELQNDSTTGHSIIRLVSPEVFVKNGYGNTRTIFAPARNGVPAGNPKVASTALSMVGQDLGKYSPLTNNCHMFSLSCLKAAESDEEFSVAKMQDLSRIPWKVLLTNLKMNAEEILGANSWQIWNWEEQPVLGRNYPGPIPA